MHLRYAFRSVNHHAWIYIRIKSDVFDGWCQKNVTCQGGGGGGRGISGTPDRVIFPRSSKSVTLEFWRSFPPTPVQFYSVCWYPWPSRTAVWCTRIKRSRQKSYLPLRSVSPVYDLEVSAKSRKRLLTLFSLTDFLLTWHDLYLPRVHDVLRLNVILFWQVNKANLKRLVRQ